MPHDVTLITTIAASLAAALLMGFIAVRIGLPALVGYLVGGIIIGPATPGIVADTELARQLAEIGVMLLMFGVGLHFSVSDLMAVRRIALPGAIAQMAVATALGVAVSWQWGWSLGAGIVFGLALSVASTVVLLKALEQLGELESDNGRIAVGWLVVEDLAMVLVLVLLPPLSASLNGQSGSTAGAFEWGLLGTLALTLGKVAVFIALMIVLGRRLFPWLLRQVARTGSRELFTLAVVAVAVGIAYGASEIFGVSFALGAFAAGMVLRESELSYRAAEESLPLRDAFSVLFFVSVGMLFDPEVLLQRPLQVLGVVLIIIVGKSLAAGLIVLAFRRPLHTALTVSASLAQIGEFSFILASLGLSLGLLPPEGQSLIVAGALISIAVNPLLFRAIEPLRGERSRPMLACVPERPLASPATLRQTGGGDRVVIVGFGRVGGRIGDALRRRGVGIVAVDRDHELAAELCRRGIPAIVGDASTPEVLVQAGISRARMLVLATPDTSYTKQVIAMARTLKPDIETVVRTHSDEEAAMLREARAGRVFMGERELARSMTQHVLERLAGAPGARDARVTAD
jgi:monovalent cation:H+ antiporter-2, CPA2 family